MSIKYKFYFGIIITIAFLGSLKIIQNEFTIRNLNKQIEKESQSKNDLYNQFEELKVSCSALENYNKMEEITNKKINK